MPIIHNRTTLPPLPGQTEPSTAAAGDSWEQAWTNRSGWGGWGERTPTPPLPPGFLLETPLNHLRADLMESRLTWDGHPERTTVHDHEETTRWAEIQCNYLSGLNLKETHIIVSVCLQRTGSLQSLGVSLLHRSTNLAAPLRIGTHDQSNPAREEPVARCRGPSHGPVK